MTRVVISLDGPQASGKSTLLRWLVPALRALGVTVDCVIDSGRWAPWPSVEDGAVGVRDLSDLHVTIRTERT